MPPYLNALHLQNFRGIGPEVQKLGPFHDFNFFIGANNSGKSTVLDFLYRFLAPNDSSRKVPDGLDRHTGASSGPATAGIGIPIQQFINDCPPQQGHYSNIMMKFCRSLADADGFIWLELPFQKQGKKLLQPPTAEQFIKAGVRHEEIRSLWRSLRNSDGGSMNEHWIPQIIQTLLKNQKMTFPTVQLIPALRQIGAADEPFSDLSGRGLIDKLASIQSPDHDQRGDRKLFDGINRFLQVVIDRSDAQIEIPHNRAHVLVHADNKVLPLSSLGTGIHQVIMLAAFCTMNQDQIICIEEPELHLHPLLQRKLIAYLKQQTSNQYFVATHSSSFIEMPDSAIFHTFNDGKQTRIQRASLRRDRFAICTDLGVRASDLLQSNAVIWVEGPSDRIYVQHWIAAFAPDLIEGIHYSIMFYGGRLLSHLSASDNELNEFISLRALNQHSAILIDSDRSDSSASINSTKERVVSELGRKPGLAWITAGREIENYINHSTLQQAVKLAHPEIYQSPLSGKRYDHALYFKRNDSKTERNIDKVKVAKMVCEQPADLSVLDLQGRITELVEMLRTANQ